MRKNVMILFAILMICGCGGDDGEEKASVTTSASTITKRYLLSFLACNTATTDCNDPRNHKTYIAQSDDGQSWSMVPEYTPHSGSVPDLIRRGDTLYVYTPGKVRKYFFSSNTWGAALDITIRLSDGTAEMFVDPSAVIDGNGRLVLFYLVGEASGDPARCSSGQSACTKIFRSATEADGSDGTEFMVDPGNRAEIAITSSETASDPDIFQDSQNTILYISKGVDVQALSGTDLKGTYTSIQGLEDGMLVRGSGGIPCGYFDQASGMYWTYVHLPRGNTQVIRLAVHGAVNQLLGDSDFTDLITGDTFPELGSTYTVASPGFTVNTP